MVSRENISPYYEKLVAPYEDENRVYIKSFALAEEKEIGEFFRKYGFVVVRNVLNQEELDRSIEELHTNLNDNCYGKYDRNNIETLRNLDRFTKRFGLIGGGDPVMLPQAILNRVHDNVYDAHVKATGRKKFLCAHERYGFMIPTKIFPDMKTIENWLHLDYNPLTGRTSTFGYEDGALHETLTEKNPLAWQHAYFQAIVALKDCPEEVGGFDCVPGFQNYCEEWKEKNRDVCRNSAFSRDPTTVRIPKEDEVYKWVQKIPIRKGSLIIWDGRLAHSNFPNDSENPRMVQYVKLNAVGEGIISQIETRLSKIDEEDKIHLKGLVLTERQKKIVGLIPWE